MTSKTSMLRYKAALKAVQEKTDLQLADLQRGEVREKIDRIFASVGKSKKRPIAGPSY